MFKKSPLKSSRLVKRKRQILQLKIVLVLIILAGCIFLLFKLAHLYKLQIHTVSVVGNSSVDTDSITAVVNNDLAGSYFWFVPKTNVLFYPKTIIAPGLLSAFPRLRSASISESQGILTITVTERVAAYTWCAGTPDSLSDSDVENTTTGTSGNLSLCYFMDSSGFIFSPAPVFSGNALFSLYGVVDTATSTSATTINPIGQQFLNAADLQKFQSIVSLLESHDLTPSAVFVGQNGVDTTYLSSGTQIIFTDSQDLDTLSANLETIISKTPLFDPDATTTLDYLDLRFGNKVYYRFKNGT